MLTVKDFLIRRLALAQDICYDPYRSSEILVYRMSNNYGEQLAIQNIWGGSIYSPDSVGGNRRTQRNLDRGYWNWNVMGEGAYKFCKDMEEDLFKFDKWRWEWCQKCKMEYMAREGHQHL